MLIGLAIWGTNVSRVLHDDLIDRISRSVIAFFDATPIGRILTRLSEDMSLIDFLLQVIFVQTINNVMLVVAAFVAIGVGSWMVFVATLAVVIAYYCLQLYFRKGNIEIQRLVLPFDLLFIYKVTFPRNLCLVHRPSRILRQPWTASKASAPTGQWSASRSAFSSAFKKIYSSQHRLGNDE